MTPPASDLHRFRAAQDQPSAGYAQALREVQNGAKRSHWIWYVLPQLSGLGQSAMARTYGIRGLAEAQAYLRDPVLRPRLLAMIDAIARHVLPPASTPLASVMGSDVDARKAVSCLTLFEQVARRMPPPDQIDEVQAVGVTATRVLDTVAPHGYGRCATTIAFLESDPTCAE